MAETPLIFQDGSDSNFSNTIACYRQKLATEPVSYTLISKEKNLIFNSINIR